MQVQTHARLPMPEAPRAYSGTFRRIKLIIWACAVLFAVVKVWDVAASFRGSAIAEIKSGVAGECVDVRHDSKRSGAMADIANCNGRASQTWTASGNTIVHNKILCLAVQNNGARAGEKIVAQTCNGSPAQAWTRAIGGFENPASALCLATPASKPGTQLTLASCTNLTQASEIWQPATWSKASSKTAATVDCNIGSRGEKVACNAAKQFAAWQSGAASHNTLLNEYSDGNGYEEWCADFVSYVYQQAGYPFTNGERAGWDEYVADNIQNMGFTYHDAANYTPQAGDVAFFNYPGGHVEIVAVGGNKPIFIYGDSGTTDPTTGNGQMAENTITSDSEGQLVYYLSPN